jgi:predicted GNAT family acetyltransferase
MSLRLRAYNNATEFLDVAGPALRDHEAEANLMLGLALKLSKSPASASLAPALLATVSSDAEGFVLAALLTPARKLTLFSKHPRSSEALELLVEHLRAVDAKVPGVYGTHDIADAFSRRWSRYGYSYHVDMSMAMFRLMAVEPPARPAPGLLRKPLPTEHKLLTDWMVAFHTESLPEDLPREVIVGAATEKLAAGDLYVWSLSDSSPPLMFLGRNRRTPHAWCIGPVYTPPENRSKGYATSATAALSSLLLRDEGVEFLVLHTDLSNPTSNKIYQSVGYKRLMDLYSMAFKEAPRSPLTPAP